ncbi:MAG: hypothetical protein ACI4MZ_06985 [Christensenellales bacterium]
MINVLALSNPNTTTPQMLEEMLQKPSGLKWYIVPLFVIWLFLIVNEIRQKHYSVVFGAAAFWLWDVFNETWNSMVYATTGQPVWGTTAAGGSALQILIGYNIEISFMFFILGMLTCRLLKTTEGYEGVGFWDGNKNWLDDPNNMYYKANVKKADMTSDEYKTKVKAIMSRILVIVIGSAMAVVIEILLNKCNVLTWEKPWWQANFPFVLFIIGYVPFYVAAIVIHDLPRKWQIIGIACIAFVVILLLIVAGALGMLGPQTDGNGNWIGKYWNGSAT